MTRIPESRTIPGLLDELATRFGEREALVGFDQRLTYRMLRDQVRLAARGLRSVGVDHGSKVGILMGNRVEWVISFLAAQHLGAIAVGLSTWSTPRELQYALVMSEVEILVCASQFRKTDYRALLSEMRAEPGAVPRLRKVVWVPASEVPDEVPSGDLHWMELASLGKDTSDQWIEHAARRIVAEDVAMLLFTSGSTAAPKGILLQHGNWVENAFYIGERQHVTEADRLWLAVSLFWSFGCVNALPNMLTHGACVILQEHFDASPALRMIEAEHCSIIYATPNMTQALLEQQSADRRDLSSLRSGATIGAPHQIMSAVNLGAAKICNVYGLSETYGNCTVTDADDPLSVRLSSVGRPLPGIDIRITDLETNSIAPIGTVGEIRVRGRVFAHYFNDDEKTRDAFDAEGFFRTGDLGLLDEEGRLFYRGRLKEMVKSGGINISPIEVEEVLLRHPAVHTAYVIGFPDPHLDEVLAAVIVAQEGASVSEGDLRSFCKKELAAYKVPARFYFAHHADLPLTSTGKVQKARLHTLLGER